MAKVRVASDTQCWLWTAATHEAGYGMINIGGRIVRAHRVLFELTRGPIPDGRELDHLCRTRGCINPAHLEPVTHQVNMARGHFGMKTHCPREHPYSGANLYVRPDGHRECRTCRRAQQARVSERRKRERRARRS